MPNAEWEPYVRKYYPDYPLDELPAYESDASVPWPCINSYRAGAKMKIWSASDKIQYGDTDKEIWRTVVITLDCEPGNVYVEWILGDPEKPAEHGR